LFLENGIDNIQLLVDNLSASGYILDNFIDHLKASSVYEKDPDKYNVVIVDLQSTSNHELREIKNMNKNVKILAITASEIDFNGIEIDGVLKNHFTLTCLCTWFESLLNQLLLWRILIVCRGLLLLLLGVA
jgi:hypothetical protein